MEEVFEMKVRLRITGILKKTNTEMYKNCIVGDIIEFSVELSPAGRNDSTYAKYIYVYNERTSEYTRQSFNQLSAFKIFIFEKVEEN